MQLPILYSQARSPTWMVGCAATYPTRLFDASSVASSSALLSREFSYYKEGDNKVSGPKMDTLSSAPTSLRKLNGQLSYYE